MKSTLTALTLSLIVLLPIGCSDGGPDYPAGDGSWQVVVNTGRIPNAATDFPIFVTIDARAIDLSTGARPSDGSVLVFSASDGTWENGRNEMERSMRNGKARSDLRIEHSGSYHVTVDFPEESCTADTSFDIGL